MLFLISTALRFSQLHLTPVKYMGEKFPLHTDEGSLRDCVTCRVPLRKWEANPRSKPLPLPRASNHDYLEGGSWKYTLIRPETTDTLYISSSTNSCLLWLGLLCSLKSWRKQVPNSDSCAYCTCPSKCLLPDCNSGQRRKLCVPPPPRSLWVTQVTPELASRHFIPHTWKWGWWSPLTRVY